MADVDVVAAVVAVAAVVVAVVADVDAATVLAGINSRYFVG